MEDEDDYYVRIGKYHPTDISVPGSMEVAERAQERRKLKMEIMRGLADEPPAATSTCSAPETSSARLSLQSSRRARRRLSTTCRTTWLARPKGLKIFMLRRGVNRTKTRSRGARRAASPASRTSRFLLQLCLRTATRRTSTLVPSASSLHHSEFRIFLVTEGFP